MLEKHQNKTYKDLSMWVLFKLVEITKENTMGSYQLDEIVFSKRGKKAKKKEKKRREKSIRRYACLD